MPMRPSEDSELLTSEDVLKRLVVDPVLHKQALTCILPAIRCGTEWRFRRADLEAWIDRQRPAATNRTN